ncbi:MAG: YIP1 family protein [Nitrospira sp.]|nr:hypothetical protein [Candidatus Manganitrophaceae bacterium]HIL35579.1 hypothetical protein [Candidatus Manganitrophaceae bacterium]
MFLNRILRALQLEDAVYEELASDPAPLAQSILLVALSSLSVGVGGSGGHSENILPGTITFLIAWTLSVIIIYIIGMKVFPGQARHKSILPLLRTTGFASSPGLVRLLGFPPATSAIVAVGASLWMFGAMVIAVRHTFQYQSIQQSLRVCVFGWIVYLVIIILR